jgi:hypothetical protein
MPKRSAEPNLHFTKAELVDRLILVNSFRLVLGSVFFVFLIILFFLRLYFSPGTEATLFLGLYLFSYSFLTQYYIKTSKRLALVEVLFLSGFVLLLDIILITGFVYFSGAGESPFFIFYGISLINAVFTIPYFLPSVFICWGIITFLYEGILFMVASGQLPTFPRFLVGQIGTEVSWRITLTNAVGVPLILLGLAIVAYLLAKYLLVERRRFERILVEDDTTQEEIAAVSNISWILTRINDVDYMLEQVLEESFKILKLHSGAIFIVNPKNKHYHKKVSIGVPSALNDYLTKLKPGHLPSEDDRNLAHLMKQEKMESLICRPLLAPRGVKLGMIIFFVKEGEGPGKRGLFVLDSIVNELGIALAYALFCGKLLPRIK